jgi:hypothetical protein
MRVIPVSVVVVVVMVVLVASVVVILRVVVVAGVVVVVMIMVLIGAGEVVLVVVVVMIGMVMLAMPVPVSVSVSMPVVVVVMAMIVMLVRMRVLMVAIPASRLSPFRTDWDLAMPVDGVHLDMKTCDVALHGWCCQRSRDNRACACLAALTRLRTTRFVSICHSSSRPRMLRSPVSSSSRGAP